ncbi:hypothetical protein DKX38_024853 [Salix brachista]|uniref:Molybdenum cofactor synthesis protein 2 large subunit n=1 Tax=Salix brachista TaxID=2182728 RepID=A0A5N5JRF1_9ROSI|nr:hypothetical protein DKX38_024853 [Salix brachista]
MDTEEKTLVEILEENNLIDLAKYINYVSASQAGAIATFSVPVGETSVFIAVSSVHRADALDACKFLIDELKASVPIWKKEVYSNGEVWKENSEFMERKLELGNINGSCCRRNLKLETHGTKSCCGSKVKVADGVGAEISTIDAGTEETI